MSQFKPKAKDESKEIHCGYDEPLKTFFVSYGTKECDCDELDLWVGTESEELTQFSEFLHILSPLTLDREFALDMAEEHNLDHEIALRWKLAVEGEQ